MANQPSPSSAAPPASATARTPPERHRPAWLLIGLMFATVLVVYLPVRHAEAKAEFETALHLRPDFGEARAGLEQLDHDR
jgi:hypothetical protein